MDKIDCGSLFMSLRDVHDKRKGYVRLCDIPPNLIVLLNRGETETATLTEQAAMDFAVWLGHAGWVVGERGRTGAGSCASGFFQAWLGKAHGTGRADGRQAWCV
jgi:hypothetical protein